MKVGENVNGQASGAPVREANENFRVPGKRRKMGFGADRHSPRCHRIVVRSFSPRRSLERRRGRGLKFRATRNIEPSPKTEMSLPKKRPSQTSGRSRPNGSGSQQIHHQRPAPGRLASAGPGALSDMKEEKGGAARARPGRVAPPKTRPAWRCAGRKPPGQASRGSRPRRG